MADETEERRVDERAPHTTIIHEKSSSSGTGIVMAVILLIAVIAGIYLFTQTTSNEAARDDAIAEAANSVGSAAEQIGETAEKAGDRINEQ